MFVHRSNRMEELVRVLGGVMARPAGGLFEPEIIVVQSAGMQRWVSMELATRLGIWANCSFPFPRTFIEQCIAAAVPEASEHTPAFSRERLTWAIAGLLPELISLPEFATVQGYLRDDDGALKRVQLAQRIAHTFDQYAVYRPNLVLEWESGASSDWQALLWRRLVQRCGNWHAAGLAQRFFSRWPELDSPPQGLPRRACVFGISSLPPLYLQVLSALAAHVEVHLFQLSPSQEYWAQVKSRREILKASRSSGFAAAEGDNLHMGEGHPLLASFGRVGRDFQYLLESLVDYVDAEDDLYRPPAAKSTLDTLQADILALRHRGASANRLERVQVSADDDSIAIHCCHSPMREVEVLRDQLLELFHRDNTLTVRDVIVMMPNVDAYAPLIEAVFSRDPAEPGFIPFRIADRVRRASSVVAEAFFAILRALTGRLKASEVLDLLQLEPVRARFGIAAGDLANIQHWVHDSGIRWAIDADDRAQAEQPPIEENTWRFGLRRMLLGYAMSGSGTLFENTLPYDEVEGDVARSVGHLADFCEQLFAWRGRLQIVRTLPDWRSVCLELLDTMVLVDDELASQAKEVRQLIAKTSEDARLSGYAEPVGFDVLLSVLSSSIQEDRSSQDFLSGGVTFCAMLPMRSIPFRVVCLMGMNDGEFPRSSRAPSFDKIAEAPQIGDRSNRDEDRYLFLEALLSARERLLITYVGRSVQDNSERPPSVVVGELLDVLDDSFARVPAEASAGTKFSSSCFVEHPLQPFSPRYFDHANGSRLFSYGAAELEGAKALVARRGERRPFQTNPLPAPEPVEELDLEQLVQFFSNPCRGLLAGRLGVLLRDQPELIEDREPIDVGALERYAIGAGLLDRGQSEANGEVARGVARGMGVLPLGTPGDCLFDELSREVSQVAAAAESWLVDGRENPVEVDLQIGGIRLRGALRDVWSRGQITRQYSRLRAKHELGVWIRHLALCSVSSPKRSVIVGRNPNPDDKAPIARVFEPLEPTVARYQLEDLLQLYWLGQSVPLCLFPSSSKVYVVTLRKLSGEADAEPSAREKAREEYWGGAGFGYAEGGDDYIRRLFEGVDPIDSSFAALDARAAFATVSTRVFEPLLSAMSSDREEEA